MGEVEDSRLRTEGCTSTETIFATAFFWPGFRRMPRGSETVLGMREDRVKDGGVEDLRLGTVGCTTTACLDLRLESNLGPVGT